MIFRVRIRSGWRREGESICFVFSFEFRFGGRLGVFLVEGRKLSGLDWIGLWGRRGEGRRRGKGREEKGSRKIKRGIMVHTALQPETGHFICLSSPDPAWPGVTRGRIGLLLIISSTAARSKLCGHTLLLTGTSIGRRVMGQLMLMRSEATSISSSSSSSLFGAADFDCLFCFEEGLWLGLDDADLGNQVEA